ncbi:serine/threonine protein kinase [Cylindrospermopsis raciborskii CS-508]|uniref:non-specific serine/threonine protein kinase n=5 Tax=Cylindrospermopsis raciborskii TaxID=77022 RepID=A0ABX4WGF8_9CYAN|nr:protein kinase [Cylindrospermopsis raciborskii]OHY33049.1 serine/threonine protein kinase [Cylindrospermopsis raciborskii CS-508]OHY34976.1 serine/threonine protein kinase [Cylindrospermopsis raciborskii CS-508]PNJ90991.1 serine/threonine protein kinase [Cylindrospermopsis raciborskii C07]PNJ92275.1 serine/threonine protein kinase [Cylindrospermopsis raciborskii C03]PNJ97192.1 serine/threonine protein kinase [Cylindrospermopsis raciborskii C04]
MNSLLINRYEIINPLGSGGFGETFLARDTQMPSQRLVVIKHLKPAFQNSHSSTELIENLFQKEAAVLEELGNHCSQIPQLYSYFSEEGEFYLVQEYIEGKNLSQVGQIKPEHATVILSSLLNTLKYVHSKNIIHRDIKPENIILRDSDRLPVLIDFGAVKETMGVVTLGSGSTVSSVVVGTRGFMAPEQTAGRPVFSTDLYALGLTIIYALTQRLPIEFSISQLTGEIDWTSYVPNLDPKLVQVLNKSIKIDLGSRYLTAEAMYSDLHTSSGIPLSTVLAPKSQEDTLVVSPGGESKNLISSLTSVVFSKVKSQNKDTKVPVNYTRVAVIALSILGLAGGFFVTQQMLEAQERAAQLEREKKEAEEKKEIAEKERLQAQQKALEAENLRQTAEQERLAVEKRQAQEERRRLADESRQARLERQRLAAERSRVAALSENYITSNTPDNNTSSEPVYTTNSNVSSSWRPTCGDSYTSGSQWWAVKGPASALSVVKNKYCGDAYIASRETQAASFSSESAAWSFANALSSASGYQFWVKKSR